MRAAVEYLATRGYDPAFGARPVKRVVQQELETALAKGILRGDFAVGDVPQPALLVSWLIIQRLLAAVLAKALLQGDLVRWVLGMV